MTIDNQTLAEWIAYQNELSIGDVAAVLNSQFMRDVRDVLLQLMLRHTPSIETPTDLRLAMIETYGLPDSTARWLLGERQRSYVPTPHPLGDVWSDD